MQCQPSVNSREAASDSDSTKGETFPLPVKPRSGHHHFCYPIRFSKPASDTHYQNGYITNRYYDDNLYYNNPVDYAAGLSDPWILDRLRQCDIRLVTGTGPWEHSESSYQLADILRSRGVPVSVDDWGPGGGHDWPYWKRQMNEYIGRLYY